MSVRFLPSLCVAAAAALVLAAAGCGKVEEAATEAAIEAASGGEAEVEVERDGDRTVIRTAEGEVTMATGEDMALPDDFPEDVYLPADYRVISVIGNSQGGRAVALATDGSLEQVLGDARQQMQGHGWTQAMAMENPDGQVLSYEKGERVAMLVLSPTADDEVRIGVTLMSPQ